MPRDSTIFPNLPSHADRENRHILRSFDLLHDLVEIQFAESIDAGRSPE